MRKVSLITCLVSLIAFGEFNQCLVSIIMRLVSLITRKVSLITLSSELIMFGEFESRVR
jgi:hypothetical protein